MTDREMDALVAEKVMGWELSTEAHPSPDTFCRTVDENPEIGYLWLNQGGWAGWSCVRCAGMPCFSTDIAAAWQVVERMRELGWEASISIMGFGTWAWEAYFDEPGTDVLEGIGKRGLANASTAPRAICLAALRALGAVTDAS